MVAVVMVAVEVGWWGGMRELGWVVGALGDGKF